MKKYFGWMAFVSLLVGILFLIVFGINRYYHSDIYTGKEAFWSQEEYTTFREFLARDSVRDFEITVLQSEMPIIVQLDSLVMEEGDSCPYGKIKWTEKWIDISGYLPAGIGLVVVGSILGKKKEEE